MKLSPGTTRAGSPGVVVTETNPTSSHAARTFSFHAASSFAFASASADSIATRFAAGVYASDTYSPTIRSEWKMRPSRCADVAMRAAQPAGTPERSPFGRS